MLTTSKSSAKNWCFTINNPVKDLVFDDPGVVRYCVWQKEKGSSGTVHYQGYIQFVKQMRLKQAMQNLDGRAHMEVARGTARRNREYCSKDEGRVEGPFEYGTIRGAGIDPPVRNNVPLGAVCHLSLKEIREEHPALYIRNQFGLKMMKSAEARVARKALGWIKPEIIVYWGPSGQGKTRRVYEEAGYGIYTVAHHSVKLWFDGYDGEDTILIDDFNGGIPFRQFLELTGGYPVMVERKGGFEYPTIRKIYITSNTPPDNWYLSAQQIKGLDVSPLERRLEEFGTVIHVEEETVDDRPPFVKSFAAQLPPSLSHLNDV